MGQAQDAAHDVAIYRAVRAAREELAAQGATLRRIRLDGELRGIVARRSETARARAGKAAADTERRRAATEYQLPIGPDGKVAFPDAQVEYTLTDEEGRDTFGRVNIEVVSEHYHAGAPSPRRPLPASPSSARTAGPPGTSSSTPSAPERPPPVPDTNARGGSNRPPSDLFEI